MDLVQDEVDVHSLVDGDFAIPVTCALEVVETGFHSVVVHSVNKRG